MQNDRKLIKSHWEKINKNFDKYIKDEKEKKYK